MHHDSIFLDASEAFCVCLLVFSQVADEANEPVNGYFSPPYIPCFYSKRLSDRYLKNYFPEALYGIPSCNYWGHFSNDRSSSTKCLSASHLEDQKISTRCWRSLYYSSIVVAKPQAIVDIVAIVVLKTFKFSKLEFNLLMVTLYGTIKFAAFEETAFSCFWTIIFE